MSTEGVRIMLQYHVLIVNPKDCGPTMMDVKPDTLSRN